MDAYFWLFCGTWCGLFGAGYMRYRLQERVATGDFSSREVTSFSRAYALWIFLPCAFLWVLQKSQGDGASFRFLNWAQPQRSLALGVQFFVWTALLWWVFIGDGASTFSRYLRAVQRSSSLFNGPEAVKVGAAAVVAAGTIAVFGGRYVWS